MPAGSGSTQGANQLITCAGITNNGTVSPAGIATGDDVGVCADLEVTPLFTTCELLPVQQNNNFVDRKNATKQVVTDENFIKIGKADETIFSGSDFVVYPNPSSGIAKVTVMNISESTDLQLLDVSGRVIKNISMSNVKTVTLPVLKPGTYMIRTINKNTGKSQTKKLTVVN